MLSQRMVTACQFDRDRFRHLSAQLGIIKTQPSFGAMMPDPRFIADTIVRMAVVIIVVAETFKLSEFPHANITWQPARNTIN